MIFQKISIIILDLINHDRQPSSVSDADELLDLGKIDFNSDKNNGGPWTGFMGNSMIEERVSFDTSDPS